MRIWRICRPEHAAFDGEGGRIVSGRWHDRGLPIIYTAGSLSLAALEFYVHLSPGVDLRRFLAISAELPGNLKMEVLSVSVLPPEWRTEQSLDRTRSMGMNWLNVGRTAVLSVPSAVIPVEQNYLLNPRHKNFSQIRINAPEPFEFDYRLEKRR